MKKTLLFFALLAPLLNACNEYEEPIDTTLRVGSIYCSDGSTIVPELFENSGKTAIGVVFWVKDSKSLDSDLAYAVALDDIGTEALINTAADVSTVTESQTAYDGASNTAGLIIFAAGESIEAPAPKLAVLYNPEGVTGWYLPSAAQAKLVNQNLWDVYSSLELVKGVKFSGWYWTSTEDGGGEQTSQLYAFTAALEEGRLSSALKSKSFKVRPIITIR